MAVLVDTCGWIEWLTDGLLADAFAPYLADPAELTALMDAAAYEAMIAQEAP